jgi:hypothetical protein
MNEKKFGMALRAGWHSIHAKDCVRLNRRDAAYYATVNEAIEDAVHTVGGYGREIANRSEALSRLVKIEPCAIETEEVAR